eukprot:2992847-Pyramimonas_sp.AAC.1
MSDPSSSQINVEVAITSDQLDSARRTNVSHFRPRNCPAIINIGIMGMMRRTGRTLTPSHGSENIRFQVR